MPYRLATEDIEPNRRNGAWLAWALDLPACYAAAPTQADALAQAPAAIAAYLAWLAHQDPSLPLPPQHAIETQLVETFRAHPSADDPAYLVNAFYDDDRRPLGLGELALARRVLEWSHQELLALLQPLSASRLSQPISGEVRGSLGGIIEHVAGAENWYLGMLGLGLDRASLPAAPVAHLERVRAHTLASWWDLLGDTRVTTCCGEGWSARKIVRRALWHQRAHTVQIQRLCSDKGREDTMTYYVYENWRAHGHTARIHFAHCSHCSDGKGTHPGSGSDNGCWHGPFPTFAEALDEARTRGKASRCKHCRPE